LGFLVFGGSQDNTHALINSSLIQSSTTEAWSSGHNGTRIDFISTPTGSASRKTWMSLLDTHVGIGLDPTAVLTLKAGTATAGTAPLKFTAGTLLTAAELGTFEYVDDGTTGHLYFTLKVATVTTRVLII
jgi:hypothetical protein